MLDDGEKINIRVQSLQIGLIVLQFQKTRQILNAVLNRYRNFILDHLISSKLQRLPKIDLLLVYNEETKNSKKKTLC